MRASSSVGSVQVVLASVAVVCVVACGTSTTNTADNTIVGVVGASSNPFNGSWSCMTTSTYTVTSPAGYPPQVVTESSSLEIDIGSGGSLTFVTGSGDGGARCSSTWDTSGSAATLPSGQSCSTSFVSDGLTVSVEGPYTSGSGSVSDGKMIFQLSATFTGTAVKGALTVALAGTYEGSSTCTQ